jgi:sulfite reductase (NADPH) hemoprotein beta-component
MATAAPQMLTANRLKDGDVLYWKAGGWVEALKDGEVFAEAAPADAALADAQSFVTGNVVVNPYLFDVRVDADGAYPVKEREIIRAAGPSVRDDLGKQADPLTSPFVGRSTRAAIASTSGGGHTATPPSTRNAAHSDLPTKGEVKEEPTSMDSFDVSI